MKKKGGWMITAAALLVGGVLYYFNTLSHYEPAKDSFDFPVPIAAEFVQENGEGKSYDWSKASEENGIPFGYKLVLKAHGWKTGEREGASVYYTKGEHKIDLISTTKHLDIIKVK